jgi:6-pyruvoyltetrahydropterin/6-carboxytetrahydropterin synthase
MAIPRTYVLTKSIEFQSAHALRWLPPSHPCHGMHGHTFRAWITVAAVNLDENAMVLDLNLIKELEHTLDHKCLNDLIEKPTIEGIANFIWEWLDRNLWQKLGAEDRGDITIVRVRVAENDRNDVELVSGPLV